MAAVPCEICDGTWTRFGFVLQRQSLLISQGGAVWHAPRESQGVREVAGRKFRGRLELRRGPVPLALTPPVCCTLGC